MAASIAFKLDAALTRTFRVTLSPGPTPPVIFLSSLAEEMIAEGSGGAEGRLLITHELLERILFARLSLGQPDSDSEPLLSYLIGCYRRSSEETRRVSQRDKDLAQALTESMTAARDLIISYTGLLLNPAMEGMFPAPTTNEKGGAALLAQHMLGCATSGERLPPGFLDHVVTQSENEGLDDLLGPLPLEISRRVRNVSPLGEFHGALHAICELAANPATAQMMARHPSWLPANARDGRFLENESLLGPLFKISTVIDIFGTGQPSVLEQCFSNLETRRQAEVHASIQSLRTNIGQLQTGLHQCIHSLLKAKGVRPKVLMWIATVLKMNKGRSKMQQDAFKNASHGFFCNLSAVMLKLCEPFLDPTKKDKLARIDANYVTQSDRIDYKEDTKLAASLDEAASWVDKRNTSRIENMRDMQELAQRQEMARVGSSYEASTMPPRPQSVVASGEYHFICECYFLTSNTLHLGLMKTVHDCMQTLEEMQRHQRSLGDLERMRSVWAGGPQMQEYEAKVEELKKVLAKGAEVRLCYETVLQDPALLTAALGFARLTAAMLLNLVTVNGKIQLPLPLPCPMEFALIPEFMVEDMAELLLYVSRFSIGLLGTEPLDEICDFVVVFIGSPLYVKNPYLRAKFVEILHLWLPGGRHQGAQRPPEALSRVFERHPLTLSHLVTHLVRLYVDIEFTGSHTQFYDKFSIRHNIGELLEYLWTIPAHQTAWVAVSKEDPAFYMRFVNMLINDAIYLLDESLKTLPEIKTLEAQVADVATWATHPQQHRHEREATLNQSRNQVHSNLTLANVHITMMRYTTEQITAPFLLPEMVERIAGMLDYFLLYLAGPERNKLRIKDPERYGFRPKELLSMITEVYINLSKGDPQGFLHVAVARDARSYRDEVFVAAVQVLRSQGILPENKIQQFEAFALKVREAAAKDQEEEEVFGEIPEEFLDPIQCTLMKDPVRLPTSNQVLDRATIQRHLLSEQRDPFNRALLTVDMLVPETDLLTKINSWISEQKARKISMDTS